MSHVCYASFMFHVCCASSVKDSKTDLKVGVVGTCHAWCFSMSNWGARAATVTFPPAFGLGFLPAFFAGNELQTAVISQAIAGSRSNFSD